MIVLQITKTAKDYHPEAKWYMFGNEQQTFETLKSAKAWIKSTYGNSKKSPMYVDEDGQTKKIGWIIGFRNEQYENGEWQKFLQQDWISVNKMEAVQLD